MGYSFRLTARVLLYAPSHRQNSTYHSLCYTSRGALAGTRIAQWVHSMKDRSNDPLHHERTLLPQSYILLDKKGWQLCLTYFKQASFTYLNRACCLFLISLTIFSGSTLMVLVVITLISLGNNANNVCVLGPSGTNSWVSKTGSGPSESTYCVLNSALAHCVFVSDATDCGTVCAELFALFSPMTSTVNFFSPLKPELTCRTTPRTLRCLESLTITIRPGDRAFMAAGCDRTTVWNITTYLNS